MENRFRKWFVIIVPQEVIQNLGQSQWQVVQLSLIIIIIIFFKKKKEKKKKKEEEELECSRVVVGNQ
jgi:hypothetical protein